MERQEAKVFRRSIVIAFLIAVLTASARGQEAQPRFFIERIEVRNTHRVSTDVVIAESLLHENQEYSENDLRDAANRLSRLPFLLSVDFALEKGSERGRHVLVLTVNETRPLFYRLDLVQYFENSPRLLLEYSDDRGQIDGESLAVGARWFVGRRGVVHGGLTSSSSDGEFSRDYAALAVGYTQYDLFGTRAFATLNLKKPIEGYGEGLLSPEVVVGVPLSVNQTLTLQYDETRFATEHNTILGEDYEERFGQRRVQATWAFNTTNDPFLPTSGTLLQLSPSHGWADGVSTIVSFGPDEEVEVRTPAYHVSFLELRGSATRYFERGESDSFWANVQGEWARAHIVQTAFDAEYDRDAHRMSAGIGYSHSLWSRERRVSGDSRIELTARYTQHSDNEDPRGFIGDSKDVRQLAAAWVRRSSWGTLRLGAGYAW